MQINLRGFFQRIFDSVFGRKVEPKKYNFLFVCTGNTCRSPMAAIFMQWIKTSADMHPLVRQLIGSVDSAGLAVTDHKAAANAVLVASNEYETDLRRHIPQQLTQEVVDKADIILAMDSGAANTIRSRYNVKGTVMALSTFGLLRGPVSDPYGGSYELYVRTARQMEHLIIRGLQDLAVNPRGNGI